MSFGSSIRYASLKDAYGPVKMEANEPREKTIAEVETEKFVSDPEPACCAEDTSHGIECAVVQAHCSTCGECSAMMQPKKYGPIGTSLNEILNLILIFLLIWILIFKPKL